MIQVCVDNALKFRFVLMNSWYASEENFDFIRSKGGHFIAPLKDNRLIALSEEDKKQERFVRVDELQIPLRCAVRGWLKGHSKEVLIASQAINPLHALLVSAPSFIRDALPSRYSGAVYLPLCCYYISVVSLRCPLAARICAAGIGTSSWVACEQTQCAVSALTVEHYAVQTAGETVRLCWHMTARLKSVTDSRRVNNRALLNGCCCIGLRAKVGQIDSLLHIQIPIRHAEEGLGGVLNDGATTR